jgi:hypothetical protein
VGEVIGKKEEKISHLKTLLTPKINAITPTNNEFAPYNSNENKKTTNISSFLTK